MADGTCGVCGCTDDSACPGGCSWVEPDLCSRCAQALDPLIRTLAETRELLRLPNEPNPNDYIVVPRPIGDGRQVCIYPVGLCEAILAIGPVGLGVNDNAWYFETRAQAVAALDAWNPLTEPEPKGWWRNPSTGRRRPGGDPSKEYIQW